MLTRLPPPVNPPRPPSRAQIDRVLNVRGHAFVDPAEVPNLTARYTESYIRRRLITLENETIAGLYQRGVAVYRGLRRTLNDMSEEWGIRRLDTTPDARAMMREFSQIVSSRLQNFSRDIAWYVYNRSVLIYMAAYYGRLWQLSSVVVDETIEFTPLDRRAASRNVLKLAETTFADFEPGDLTIYNLLGEDWIEWFADDVEMLVIGIRRDLRQVMRDRGSNTDATDAIAEGLGLRLESLGRRKVPEKLSGELHRMTVIARSYMIESMNKATVQTYEDNADLVWGVRFLTSTDGRVCPMCQALLGKQWPLGSLEIKYPVSDTHPQCRCTLLSVQHRDIQTVGSDARPKETFKTWLQRVGADDLIDRLVNVRPATDGLA